MKFIVSLRSNVCDSEVSTIWADSLDEAIKAFLLSYYHEDEDEIMDDDSSIIIIQRDGDSFWEYALSKTPVGKSPNSKKSRIINCSLKELKNFVEISKVLSITVFRYEGAQVKLQNGIVLQLWDYWGTSPKLRGYYFSLEYKISKKLLGEVPVFTSVLDGCEYLDTDALPFRVHYKE